MTVNEGPRTADEAQIHRLIDDRRVLYPSDVDAVMAHRYAPNVLVFDLAPPLRHAGATCIAAISPNGTDSFRGPIGSRHLREPPHRRRRGCRISAMG